MLCRSTQDEWVMVESSDKTSSSGEGNGKPLKYSCLENPMNSMKRQKDRTLKGELPRLVGAKYPTVGQWRNNSRKNEETEPKQKQHPVSLSVSLSHQEASISLLSFSIRENHKLTENHKQRKLTDLMTWTTTLSNSMKL